MASVQPQRGGARWVKSLSTPALQTPPIVEKLVASNNTLALFAGDLLQIMTDGTVYPCTVGGGAYPGLSFIMVSASNYVTADGLTRTGTYVPAATTYTGTVSLTNPLATKVLCIPISDGQQVFEMDVPTAAATTTAAAALVGQCVDILATAGSTTTGLSGFTSDTVANFQASTTTNQLLLRQIPNYGLNGMLNDVTATYWKGWFTAYEVTVAI